MVLLIQHLGISQQLHFSPAKPLGCYGDGGAVFCQKDFNLPKGHLAKPFKMDDNSFLHIMDSGLYLIKEKRDDDGEVKQTRTFISHSAIILGEARSLNNDNWKRVIRFQDKDNTQHTILVPYEHFMGEAQEALKIIANHGLMPPRQTYKKNVFINYIQDYRLSSVLGVWNVQDGTEIVLLPLIAPMAIVMMKNCYFIAI